MMQMEMLYIKYVAVATSVLQGLSLLMTLFRLYFRLKIRRFWLEDAWAAVVFILGITNLISEWAYLTSREYLDSREIQRLTVQIFRPSSSSSDYYELVVRSSVYNHNLVGAYYELSFTWF